MHNTRKTKLLFVSLALLKEVLVFGNGLSVSRAHSTAHKFSLMISSAGTDPTTTFNQHVLSLLVWTRSAWSVQTIGQTILLYLVRPLSMILTRLLLRNLAILVTIVAICTTSKTSQATKPTCAWATPKNRKTSI